MNLEKVNVNAGFIVITCTKFLFVNGNMYYSFDVSNGNVIYDSYTVRSPYCTQVLFRINYN